MPEPPYVVAVRSWIQQGGGVLAIDSPRLATRMLDLFERVGLPRLVEGYLGEPGLLSLHKTTLRKARPAVGGAWHQDGAFMGDARALNLWLSLSRCGDEAPGLDLVPRRLDEIVVEHEEMLFVELTRERAAEAAAAGGVEIVRPIFEPGDALFFDEMFLHQTGSDPSMPNPRFAIESWFFGAHGFPADYAPARRLSPHRRAGRHRGAWDPARRSASPSTASTRCATARRIRSRASTYREHHALRDVSFDVRQGEFFGIVGRNGSGKSSLLKILASIYRADGGRARIAGRVAPFIELGVGFNHELTARENGVLNGVLMGLTLREARQPARSGRWSSPSSRTSSTSSSRTTRRGCSSASPSR